MQNRKIRMGMVGGGQGAFIGGVHRIAAAIDQQIELVCGAFSSDPERSKASGKDLHLEDSRCYTDFMTMMAQEAKLPERQRRTPGALIGWRAPVTMNGACESACIRRSGLES